MGKTTGHETNDGQHLLEGRDWYRMLQAGLQTLEDRVEQINGLNVFPVPDRDTGTNMWQTLRDSLSSARRADEWGFGRAAGAVAEAALYGARGNSGVLLAQFLRGFAQAASDSEQIDARGFAAALRNGATAARDAVSKPVEGTILTVMREAAKSADDGLTEGASISTLVDRAVRAARVSLRETPTLLPLLGRAGVVDAGAAGFVSILEGMRGYFGDASADERLDTMVTAPEPLLAEGDRDEERSHVHGRSSYGYCTELLVRGRGLNLDHLRARLEPLGQSLLMIGTRETVRVHLHAADPGKVLSECLLYGNLQDINIRNMDEQVSAGAADQTAEEVRSAYDSGVVAVSAGEGFAAIFRSLGAAVIPLEELREDGSEGLLSRIQALPFRELILLPNDNRILSDARSLQPIPSKNVAVIESRTMAAGIAGLIEWEISRGFEENRQRMTEAAAGVTSIEIDTDGKRFTATMDGQELGSDGDLGRLCSAFFERIDRPFELATLYHAEGAEKWLVDTATGALQTTVGVDRLEVAYGGQRSPLFILSIE